MREEFLRNVYAASGLRVRPRTQVSRLEMPEKVTRALGMNLRRYSSGGSWRSHIGTVIEATNREEQVKT